MLNRKGKVKEIGSPSDSGDIKKIKTRFIWVSKLANYFVFFKIHFTVLITCV